MQDAIAKKDYKRAMAILDKIFSPSFLPYDDVNAIMFKDVKQIVKTKEDLENILLSTKVAVENKDELIEFFEMLLRYGFKENAISYFEEIIKDIEDIELIDGFNLLLK
ncbi:hypothetical protein CMTB2_04582 [Caminibacter mediatlanticus TB-2]|uniref:Uncharacterized protein n=1 Tax=Caminibacter mediatlanticus TB-2 TaxID=391592 RepID=A0AAI9AGH3_9BACT|nr:hypothetical protein CMTB2_04582 [Caminibacter mediatlanticus TB-2]